MDQEKYILEEVRPISVERGRLSHRDNPLDANESKSLRSLIYKLNWVGRESRPEAAGVASILAARIHVATGWDVICANKLARHLRATASRGATIWAFDPQKMCFATFSDAGGVGADIKVNDLHHRQLQQVPQILC